MANSDLYIYQNRIFALGAGGDIMVRNAVLDGIFIDKKVDISSINLELGGIPFKIIPDIYVFELTEFGVEFINKLKSGESIF